MDSRQRGSTAHRPGYMARASGRHQNVNDGITHTPTPAYSSLLLPIPPYSRLLAPAFPRSLLDACVCAMTTGPCCG